MNRQARDGGKNAATLTFYKKMCFVLETVDTINEPVLNFEVTRVEKRKAFINAKLLSHIAAVKACCNDTLKRRCFPLYFMNVVQ